MRCKVKDFHLHGMCHAESDIPTHDEGQSYFLTRYNAVRQCCYKQQVECLKGEFILRHAQPGPVAPTAMNAMIRIGISTGANTHFLDIGVQLPTGSCSVYVQTKQILVIHITDCG